MNKKFVPLNNTTPAENNPYQIRTWQPPVFRNDSPQSVPFEITHLNSSRTLKPKPDNVLNTIMTPFREVKPIEGVQRVKKKCDPHDSFKECVRLKRNRTEIQDHAIAREKVLEIQEKIRDGSCQVRMQMKKSSDKYDLIKFESLADVGPVKPASPSPSLATIPIPSKRVLALKKVKSGIFINETHCKDVKEFELDYNPRILQERIEAQCKVFDIAEVNNRRFVRLAMRSSDGSPEKCVEFNNEPYMKTRKASGEEDNFLRPNLEIINLEWKKPSSSVINNDLNITSEPVTQGNILHSPLRSRIDVVLFTEFRLPRTLLTDKNRRPKEIATIYSAYAQSVIQPLCKWNMSTMQQIFQRGDALHEKSTRMDYENCDSDFDIDPYVVIGKTPMTIDCSKPSFIAGTINGKYQTLPMALRIHLADKTSCLIGCDNSFILIWKQCRDFYFFDPHGRNRETLVPDEHGGYATLLRCSTSQDLVDLISCEATDDDWKPNFRLYDIRLRNFNVMNSISKPQQAQLSKPKKNYAVVNKHYAVIRGREGLRMNAKAKINPSMLISCLARIYADVDEPRFWTSNVLDQFHKYSMSVYQKQMKAEKLKNFSISNLKPIYRIGSFRTEIVTEPFVASGKINECPTFRKSQLSAALCMSLENYESLLIQIDSSTMVAWKDHDFFYVYDPFCRSANGVTQDNDPKSAACLQIHLNLRSLCHIIYENARKMVPDGNFFIHALKVVRTRVVQHSKLRTEKVTFPLLLLDYPAKCEEIATSIVENSNNIESSTGYLNKCLSVLSVSPCERTCSETDILEMERKEKSRQKKLSKIMERNSQDVEPLPDEVKIPWYDSYDVIEPIVDSLVDSCCRSAIDPDKDNLIGKARKVLLKSDRDNLEGLLRSVERGDDYDNYFTDFPRAQTIADYAKTLENELKTETAFELIPDGDWIVVGNKRVTVSDDEFDLGILASFVTTVLAGKYNIKFWSAGLLDYSIRNAMALRSSKQITGSLLSFLASAQMPNMEIAQIVYKISVDQLAFGSANNLQNILLKAFEKCSNLILVFNTLSCAIFKRNVFYFLYVGHPCDIMGFRGRTAGAPTLVRTLGLDSIVRRIHANRFNTTQSQRATAFGIKTREVTNQRRPFVALTPSEEEIIYDKEKDTLEKKDDQNRIKVLFLKDELQKENQRISAFRKEKYGHEDDEYTELTGEEEYNEIEEDPHPQPKHLPGTELSSTESMYNEQSKQAHSATRQLGYRYYKPDYNFKIQGSTALDDRQVAGSIKEIRPCHLASLFAIMYAIHQPLKDWDFRRVDMVIENAKQLDNLIRDKSVCCSRKINNVSVDDFVYNLEIKKDDLNASLQDMPIKVALDKISMSRNYFLIQFANVSFAVHKGDYYHIFDPYNTLDVVKESTDMNKPRPLKNVKPLQDRNTASWITFPNLDFLLTYIGGRATSRNWQTEFNLFVINILSVKKAPKKHRLNHILANSPIHPESTETEYQIAELQPEQVVWIDRSAGNLPWCPLSPTNMNNDKRGSVFSKWKSFDVELPGKLYSMWGNIHPRSGVFGDSRGKQYLAINVIACCMAHVYHVEEWTPNILDAVVVNGDKYFRESTHDIVLKDYEMTLEDLNTEFNMSKLCKFVVHLESVSYGLLYDSRPRSFNLSRALSYFFANHRYGIIQCMRKSLCFGKTRSGYFLFDCQSYGEPLFAANEGCAYILVAATLDVLLYCMTVTLNVLYYNTEFVIHAITVGIRKFGSSTALPSSLSEKGSERTLADDSPGSENFSKITTNAAEYGQTQPTVAEPDVEDARSLVSSEQNY